MHTVTFLPSGENTRAKVGRTLLNVIRSSKMPIGFSCRGQGVCTACVVWVWGDAGPMDEMEQTLLKRLPSAPDKEGGVRRIACLAQVRGDVSIQAEYW